MAWNLPEDQKKPKPESDPWTGRRTENKKIGEQQPPNLESLLRDGWLKVKRGWRKPRSFNPRPWSIAQWSMGVIGLVWLSLGVYHVNANQLAYVMRLGVYQGQLALGWQWRAWGLYQVHVLAQPLSLALASEVMTQDLNLAKVSVSLTYRINDPKAYLFALTAPVQTQQALAHGALQQAVGHVDLAVLLSEKNPPILMNSLKSLLQSAFDQAGLGMSVDSVQVDNVAIPDTLQELFNKMNALYLTQSTEKQKNIEYQQRVLPPAVLKAQLWLTAANAYDQQTQIKAKSEVADFLSLLPSYERAPKVIKYQLYTKSMTTILSESSTVVVDAKGPAPMIVLADNPLKKVTSAALPPVIEESSVTASADESYGNVKGGYE